MVRLAFALSTRQCESVGGQPRSGDFLLVTRGAVGHTCRYTDSRPDMTSVIDHIIDVVTKTSMVDMAFLTF